MLSNFILRNTVATCIELNIIYDVFKIFWGTQANVARFKRGWDGDLYLLHMYLNMLF